MTLLPQSKPRTRGHSFDDEKFANDIMPTLKWPFDLFFLTK